MNVQEKQINDVDEEGICVKVHIYLFNIYLFVYSIYTPSFLEWQTQGGLKSQLA